MFITPLRDIITVSDIRDRKFDYSMIDEVVKTILDHCNPDLIYLFGSTASGTARYGSDIDILLVTETDERPIDRGIDILNALDIDTTVDLIVLTPEEFTKYRSNSKSFTSKILNTGRPIYGTV